MYQASSAFGNLIQESSRTFMQKLIVDGTTEISYGIRKVKLNGGSNSEDNFSLGSAISQYIEIEISAPPVKLEGHEIQYLIGMEVSGSVEYVPMGYFTAGKPEGDEGFVKVLAYDRMMKTERAFFSGLPDSTNTLSVLRQIESITGVSVVTEGLSSIGMKNPKGYTCREVLSLVAQLYGGFAICNRQGQIEIKSYVDSGYGVGPGRYWDSFTHSDLKYVLNKITCYTGKGEDGKDMSISVGSGAGGIAISNAFMTQSILTNVWNKLKNYSYMPGTVKFLGDPRIDPWDVITVNDRNGESYAVPAMKLAHECDGGLTTEVMSVGKTEAEETEGGFKGPMARTEDRIYTEFALINHAMINKLDAEEASITYATISNLNAINADIENLDVRFATIDLANIKNGCITTAMIGTGVIGTTQIADGSITDAKIVELTANKITAGTIDAANIEVINLNCANLTVGTINGQQIAPGAVDLGNLSDGVIKMLNDAQTAGDGSKIFYQASAPPTSGRKVGDTWFDTDDGYRIYRFNGASWIAAQLGGDALAANSVTTSHIVAGAINTDRIAANAVTAAKIAVGTITAANIASGTITGDKISSYAISSTNLASDSVTADKIVSRSITAAKIASGAITANEIASLTITSAKLAAGAVTADKIAAGAVTAGKINVTDLYAIGATVGGFKLSSARIVGADPDNLRNVYLANYDYNNSVAFRVTTRSSTSDTWSAKITAYYDGRFVASDATIKGTIESIDGNDYCRISSGRIDFGYKGSYGASDCLTI